MYPTPQNNAAANRHPDYSYNDDGSFAFIVPKRVGGEENKPQLKGWLGNPQKPDFDEWLHSAEMNEFRAMRKFGASKKMLEELFPAYKKYNDSKKK